jgi:hypothetical protein
MARAVLQDLARGGIGLASRPDVECLQDVEGNIQQDGIKPPEQTGSVFVRHMETLTKVRQMRLLTRRSWSRGPGGCALQVVCEQLFGTSALAGRRVLVQGAGSVGGALAIPGIETFGWSEGRRHRARRSEARRRSSRSRLCRCANRDA